MFLFGAVICHRDLRDRGSLRRTLPKFYEEHRASELKIAVLRIDANFHDSYQDALFYLYEFVPVTWIMDDSMGFSCCFSLLSLVLVENWETRVTYKDYVLFLRCVT